MKRYTYGVLFAASSGVLFGLAPLLIQTAYAGGSNGITTVFLRSVLALPVLFLLARLKGERLAVSRKEIGQLLLLGVCGSAMTSFLLYSSYNFISTGIATTLHFSYPLLVNIGCAVFLGERFTKAKSAALLLGLLGIVLFMGNDSDLQPTGVALALLSGVSYAFYMIYMSASGLKCFPPFKLAFYVSLVVSIATGLFGLITKQITLSLTPTAWGNTLLLACGISIGANSLFQLGIRDAGASTTAILSTLEPITSVLMGCVALHEGISGQTLAGCLCIFGSVLTITVSNALQGKLSMR